MKIRIPSIVNVILGVILVVSIASLSTSAVDYDPWLDVTDDGYGGIDDIVATAEHFGASGDPIKNVTITGHANKLAYSISDQYIAEDGSFNTPWISVDGYSKVSISLYTSSTINQYVLMAKHIDGFVFRVDAMDNVTFHFFKTYDIPNELISVFYQDYSGFESWIHIDIYLIP
ncbi:MAG: hypothetical protein JSV05_06065 [Candidatus Bathyarchaeota archaeon]|nr:MAG: hypothetical protein JSV05_06065 [Candidatus Bathyarchaeota archaeon]